MAEPLVYTWSSVVVSSMLLHKRQLSTGGDDAMNIEPRQISLMPVLVGCGLNLFVFGLVLGTGGALLNAVATTARVMTNANVSTTATGRRAHAMAIVSLAAIFGGLRLALDVHTAQRVWQSDTQSTANVIDDFATVDDPVGIRCLCALTACMALPQLARQVVRMGKRAVVPTGVTLFVALTVLVTVGTGIVASVLRTGSVDPGWAADNDHSIRQTMQLTLYACLTLSCALVGLESWRASHQARNKDNATPSFDEDCEFPYVSAAAIAMPGVASLVVLLASLLCADHSTALIALMPLGNVFALVFLVDSYLATAHRQATMATAMAQPQVQPFHVSSSPPRSTEKWKDGSTGHASSSSSVLDFEPQLLSSSSYSCVNMPIHHDDLAATMTAPSVRKMNVDFGTPTFLRSDPYAAASLSSSASSFVTTSPPSSRKSSPASSLRYPNRVRQPTRVRAKSSFATTTERNPSLVSSPLSRSVSAFQIENDFDDSAQASEDAKEEYRRSQQALVLMQRALLRQSQSDLASAGTCDVLEEIDSDKSGAAFDATAPKHKASMTFTAV